MDQPPAKKLKTDNDGAFVPSLAVYLQNRKYEAHSLIQLGNQKYEHNDVTGSIESYTKALPLWPLDCKFERAITFGNRAVCYYCQLKFHEAIDDCTRALELYPTYLKILVLRAVIYEHLGHHSAALADYQRAYNKDKCAIATAMMFYCQQILRRKGQFGIIWIAATHCALLKKSDYLDSNLQAICDNILDYICSRRLPGELRMRFSLYLSSQLMYGVVKVYAKKHEYLFRECKMLYNNLDPRRIHNAALLSDIDLQHQRASPSNLLLDTPLDAFIDCSEIERVLEDEMFPPPALAWSPGASPQTDQLPRQRAGTKRKRNSKDDSSPRLSSPVDGGAAAVSPNHQARVEDITMVESDISSHHDLPLPGGELDLTAPTEADLDIFDRLGQGQGLTDQLAPGVTDADMLGTDILEGHFYEENRLPTMEQTIQDGGMDMEQPPTPAKRQRGESMDTLVSLTDQERADLERPPQARRKIAMPVLFDPSKQLSREEMKLQMEQHEKTIKRPQLKMSKRLSAEQLFRTPGMKDVSRCKSLAYLYTRCIAVARRTLGDGEGGAAHNTSSSSSSTSLGGSSGRREEFDHSADDDNAMLYQTDAGEASLEAERYGENMSGSMPLDASLAGSSAHEKSQTTPKPKVPPVAGAPAGAMDGARLSMVPEEVPHVSPVPHRQLSPLSPVHPARRSDICYMSPIRRVLDETQRLSETNSQTLVAASIRRIEEALEDYGGETSFFEIFPPGKCERLQAVLAFNALLEMCKARRVTVQQRKPMADMIITFM